MEKACARVEREAPGYEINHRHFCLGTSGGNVDDDVFNFAVDDGLKRVSNQPVMPVDAKLATLAMLEKVAGEVEMIPLAHRAINLVLKR